jgi:hypothetical protein
MRWLRKLWAGFWDGPLWTVSQFRRQAAEKAASEAAPATLPGFRRLVNLQAEGQPAGPAEPSTVRIPWPPAPAPPDLDDRLRVFVIRECDILDLFAVFSVERLTRFNLPPGTKIVRAWYEPRERGFVFMARHESFAPVPPGERPPYHFDIWHDYVKRPPAGGDDAA